MNINDVKWLQRFYSLTENEIANWSKDPHRKVGALAVSVDGRSLSPGYNGLAKNLVDHGFRYEDKKYKNQQVVHAEINAILNAKTDVTGWYLFCSCHPCTHCASIIIQAGISAVVSTGPDKHSSRYANQVQASLMLEEAGVVQFNEEGQPHDWSH